MDKSLMDKSINDKSINDKSNVDKITPFMTGNNYIHLYIYKS